MIKISVDQIIVDKYYEGVKDYIGKHLFIFNPEKDYFTCEKIEEIIKCKPDNFQKIIDEIDNFNLDLGAIKKAFVGCKGYYNGYKKFAKKDENQYRAYNLADALKINVCPYCNKNYTHTLIDEEGNQYVRPDFDHFLSQGKHPYFAMSFYNLIPSCQTCNRSLKHAKKFLLTTHLHPYKDDFHSIKRFSTTKLIMLCNSENDFDISFENKSANSQLTEKADNNIRDFALELQYSKHKDIVLELKEKHQLYNEISIQNILIDTKVFKDKDEEYIKALMLGTVIKDEDINKRPLNKLIKDISEQLDIR